MMGSGSQHAGIAQSSHLSYSTQSRDVAEGENADTQLIRLFIGEENASGLVEFTVHPPFCSQLAEHDTRDTTAAQHSPSNTDAVLQTGRYSVATRAALV